MCRILSFSCWVSLQNILPFKSKLKWRNKGSGWNKIILHIWMQDLIYPTPEQWCHPPKHSFPPGCSVLTKAEPFQSFSCSVEHWQPCGWSRSIWALWRLVPKALALCILAELGLNCHTAVIFQCWAALPICFPEGRYTASKDQNNHGPWTSTKIKRLIIFFYFLFLSYTGASHHL